MKKKSAKNPLMDLKSDYDYKELLESLEKLNEND